MSPEQTMPLIFTLFLLLFMLIGIYPSVKKGLVKAKRFLQSHQATHRILADIPAIDQDEHSPWYDDSPQLDEYEVFALRVIAGGGRSGVTLKALVDHLQIAPGHLEAVLKRLVTKGMIFPLETVIAGTYFVLTREGRAYAIQQGFLPPVKSRYLFSSP